MIFERKTYRNIVLTCCLLGGAVAVPVCHPRAAETEIERGDETVMPPPAITELRTLEYDEDDAPNNPRNCRLTGCRIGSRGNRLGY